MPEKGWDLNEQAKFASAIKNGLVSAPNFWEPMQGFANTGFNGIRTWGTSPKEKYQVPVKDMRTNQTYTMDVGHDMFEEIMKLKAAGEEFEVQLETNVPEYLEKAYVQIDSIGFVNLGFRDDNEFVDLANQIDFKNKDAVEAFNYWVKNDCSKGGLGNLIDHYSKKSQIDAFSEPEKKFYDGNKPVFARFEADVKALLREDYNIPVTSFLLDWEEGYRKMYDMNYTSEYAAYTVYNYDY